MSIVLYGTPKSTYVRTTRLLLAEANIDYQLKDINIFDGENKTEEYLAKHPFGKVPTLASVRVNTINRFGKMDNGQLTINSEHHLIDKCLNDQ